MTEKRRAYIAAYYQRPEVLAKRPHCIDCGKLLCATAQYIGTKRCIGCSKRIDNTGRHHTDETKAKIAAAHVGKPRSEETKAKLRAAHIGKPMLPETRAKLCIARKGRTPCLGHRWHLTEEQKAKMRRGPAHPFYRHGKGMLPYSSNWASVKQTVYERDGGLCQHPGCYSPENGRHHDVHHIDGNKNNNTPANLILLCRNHHAKTYFGNPDYWMEFYDSAQSNRGIEIAINLGG